MKETGATRDIREMMQPTRSIATMACAAAIGCGIAGCGSGLDPELAQLVARARWADRGPSSYELGYPARIMIDHHATYVDDEVIHHARDLTPTP